jgi:hypothetical protein
LVSASGAANRSVARNSSRQGCKAGASDIKPARIGAVRPQAKRFFDSRRNAHQPCALCATEAATLALSKDGCFGLNEVLDGLISRIRPVLPQ